MPRLQFWRGREAWSHMWACCVSSRLWWMCWTDADLCLGSVTATTGLLRKHPSSWQRETPACLVGSVGIKLCLSVFCRDVSGCFMFNSNNKHTLNRICMHDLHCLVTQLWDMYKKLLQYPFFGRCCTLLPQNLFHSTFWGLIAIIVLS